MNQSHEGPSVNCCERVAAAVLASAPAFGALAGLTEKLLKLAEVMKSVRQLLSGKWDVAASFLLTCMH